MGWQYYTNHLHCVKEPGENNLENKGYMFVQNKKQRNRQKKTY